MNNYNTMDKNTPFNSSLAFLERIEDTWKDVTKAKLEGNITAYFRLLEDIFRSTHPIFTPGEAQACEDQIKICEGHLSQSHNNKDISMWVAENNCDKLKMMIVKLLFHYKITYFSVEELTWQDELRSDFK